MLLAALFGWFDREQRDVIARHPLKRAVGREPRSSPARRRVWFDLLRRYRSAVTWAHPSPAGGETGIGSRASGEGRRNMPYVLALMFVVLLTVGLILGLFRWKKTTKDWC